MNITFDKAERLKQDFSAKPFTKLSVRTANSFGKRRPLREHGVILV